MLIEPYRQVTGFEIDALAGAEEGDAEKEAIGVGYSLCSDGGVEVAGCM